MFTKKTFFYVELLENEKIIAIIINARVSLPKNKEHWSLRLNIKATKSLCSLCFVFYLFSCKLKEKSAYTFMSLLGF